MVLPQNFLSFFRSFTAILSALILLVVGADEKNLPEPDGAEIVNKITYTLLDADVTSQGVTNDGTYFYFSSNENLAKAPIETGEIELMHFDAIPQELQDKGCNHIGGLTYYNGYVYAAVEDGPDYLNSFIVLYDANTLEYTGTYYELPHDLHLEGVPWCAVNVKANCIYTAEWSNAKVLNVFRLDDLSLIYTLPLSEPVDRIQGAEYYNGKLYLSCDEENDQKRILSINVITGKVKTEFARNIGSQFEAEDLTITVDEDGTPIFHVLDRGERRKSINLTSYKITK